MADLKIVLWNCSGLRTSANFTAHKMGFFDKELPNANFAIAIFVETHHRGEDDFPQLIREYTHTHKVIHTPTPINHSHSGVILLIRKDLDIISSIVKIPGRLLNVKFRYKDWDKTFNLSAFYGPILKTIVKEDLRDLVQNIVDVHSRKDTNIVIGDFNFIDNDLDKNNGMDSHDKKISSFWEEFKEKINIFDPFREQFPTTKKYSFYHTSTAKSRLDRIYVSNDYLNSVKNIKYTYYPQANTHKLMTLSFASPEEKGPGYWKFNTTLLKDPPYIKLITDAIERSKSLTEEDPTSWWELLLLNIRSQTFTYSQQKSYTEKLLKRSWTKELEDLESIPIKSLTSTQVSRLTLVKEHLKKLEDKEIEGYRIRTRNIPTFEKSEPNISFFSRLEKRFIKQTRISRLKEEEGNLATKTQDLLRITSEFYKKLYTASETNSSSQKALLKNIKKTLSQTHKDLLDSPITLEELEKAVKSLNKEKSPGINGLPAEFYQMFWPLLKYRYLQFINHAFENSFPTTINTSVTSLLYKDKGDIESLVYYRPISLINTDIKILSKTLSNRLCPMLPLIIEKFQTAVDGRQIDHTVHMIRDLIDLANQEYMEAAFIFLDQEKAFDRVDHQFLYKTMSAFGIGDNFIKWVQQIYSSAITRIKVNGFLTNPIPLMRGVRQGDPLSFFLYVINSELFALLLRANPNIVGFQVGGEKIVSMHYADDTTITITQNRCFKEVYKDILTFEEATGAKVNVGKTKGLWTGAWKSRLDSPLGFEWTNKNVFSLGVFFGNDDPAGKTFQKIVPKVQKSINYWKGFHLSVLSKARVIETFSASKLLYATRFYCIPPIQAEILQRCFLEYINYPGKRRRVKQNELMKLRKDGGVKLINIQMKAEAAKTQWLFSLCINSAVSLHKALVERLLGVQRGGILGIDLFFTPKFFTQRFLQISSSFYREAITSMTSLEPRKQILDRFEENIFFNPAFKDRNGRVIFPNDTCVEESIFKYSRFVLEQGAKNRGERYDRSIIAIYNKITVRDLKDRTEFFLCVGSELIPFQKVTKKLLYEQILKSSRDIYKDHHSSVKWVEELNIPIVWDKVWKSVHNPLASAETKSCIWSQIHLNDNTTATYNSWFRVNDPCPLCTTSIDSLYHIILHCPVTLQLWSELEPFLKKITEASVTQEEMVFGLSGNTPAVHLRNLLTFTLRELILYQEKRAFHNKLGLGNTIYLQHTFNARVHRVICDAYHRLTHEKRVDLFHKCYNPNRIFLIDPNGNIERDNLVTIFNPPD